ncbi:response regulator transcription factor [Sulfurimonas sp. CS5]|uniref:response regulator transcription factor n=1 Tax=Sulfurimonas sp. CS5 TaxID=3391145 RepID=UPI0039EA0E09
MNIIFFSSSFDTIDEWKKRHNIEVCTSCYDLNSLNAQLNSSDSAIIIADYDSVAIDINHWISSSTLPQNLIVLERAPEITTGKMLVYHGVKAYGNSRMLTHHYMQMLQTVKNGNIWTYPALTSKLTPTTQKNSLNDDAKKLLENRLSQKESEVVYLILEGLTNDAIASRMDITTRTVKAHVSSIFSKLHINDRVSLVLLLK